VALDAGRAGIAYVDDRYMNVRVRPLGGGTPTRLTDFKADQTFNFAWSPDGKQLALARGNTTSDIALITDFR
jgi:Tol biopolymer transport system component